jgi:TetR/AcrR family transcriptional regulator
MATKPGERRLQILQVLAEMLQDPKGEKITTAALAKRLDVSEAALYRHFASKAQMFEGLIEFIEETVFGLANKITAEENDGLKQAHAIVGMLLNFAEKNPGMTRVLIGDALVNEDDRLQARINQVQDRLEATLKQCLRIAATQAPAEPAGEEASDADDLSARANLLLSYVVGRWHLFAKSRFKRKPTEQWERQWRLML